MKNYLEYRSLEGFVFAIAPFNFTSIAGNLPAAPALMGNVSLWKPASSAILACYYLMEMFQEAGLPDGVINFLPGDGKIVGDPILNNSNLAGVHFTGSTKTFNHIWKSIGSNIDNYKTYPRIVGETGGKDYFLKLMDAFEKYCAEHIAAYGPDNHLRLTGTHETQSIDKFSWGVADRGASIRVPHSFVKEDAYKGYLEDRRPNSQGCPYQIVSRVLKTVAEVEADFK